ncbi:hypothetical protein IAU60_001733 [Kwoniella sp. DSM 27419]
MSSSPHAHPYAFIDSAALVPFVDSPDDLDSVFCSTSTSLSPPVPHRRAPKPPTYSPRRDRPNHINMREPASCGLFTVTENDEEDVFLSITTTASSLMYHSPSAVPSSEIFPSRASSPRLDIPRIAGVEDDLEWVEKLNRLSWSSFGSSETSNLTEGDTDDESRGVTTPNLAVGRDEDPFEWPCAQFSDAPDADVEMAESIVRGRLRTPPAMSKQPTLAESIRGPRRPPALSLTTKFLSPLFGTTPRSAKNLFSTASDASSVDSDRLVSPATAPTTASLLPSVEIVSPIEWESRKSAGTASLPATPTRSRARKTRSSPRSCECSRPDYQVDLASALDDLLTSCGEDIRLDTQVSADTLDSDCEDGFETRTLRFPTPPARFKGQLQPGPVPPRTPSPTRAKYTPTQPAHFAPKKERRSYGRRTSPVASPTSLKGDHSFLSALSTGIDVFPPSPAGSSRSTTSLGSTLSRKGLPGRKALPTQWTAPSLGGSDGV